LGLDPNEWSQVLFNVSSSRIYFLLLSLLFLAWFFLFDRKKAIATLKNSRPERVAHYLLMTTLGVMLAFESGAAAGSLNWIDVFTFLTLAVSVYCSWMFAVGVNDIADREVDLISNPDRPLIKGELSESLIRELNSFFLFWSLIGAALVGWQVFFCLAVFTAAYYVYSAPPLQLKRIPGLATFLISVACLSAAMTGFFSFSADKSIEAFPPRFILLLIVVFTLASTVKDIKDVKGDAKEGVKTLLVVLGERHGKRAVGLLVLVSFWLVPIILIAPVLHFFSLPFGLAGFWLVNRKRYRELPIFLLYFAFSGLAVLMYLFLG
jgi:chlorophyll synthase